MGTLAIGFVLFCLYWYEMFGKIGQKKIGWDVHTYPFGDVRYFQAYNIYNVIQYPFGAVINLDIYMNFNLIDIMLNHPKFKLEIRVYYTYHSLFGLM